MVEIKVELSGPGAEALKEVASGGRGALRRAFGPALSEFGEMFPDQVKLWRYKNLLKIREEVDRLTSERAVPDDLLRALPFGDAMRTLEAASEEDKEDIQKLWAQLIVRAASGSEKPTISKLHIEILRSLSPADSALLNLLYPSLIDRLFHSQDEIAEFASEMNSKAEATWRKFSEEDRNVAVQNLIRLRCITATPRILDAGQVLTHFSDRERRISGALVDPKRFEEVLSKLVGLIYQAAGAVPYDAISPLPLHVKGVFGMGSQIFGQIAVPELNHMLTPLGLEFMRAVTLPTAEGKPSSA